MTNIVINYDPFAMESQILITGTDGGTTGSTYGNSELSQLAETVAQRANEFGVENTKVYVRAPQVFYDKLVQYVQAAQNTYSLTTINMEKI